MPAEFTGEQKLRIVLESIIRGVPKDEQCKKYGVSEEQFQTWHDHLIKNGGKIYEMGASRSSRSVRPRKVKYIPWFIKLLLILSIFTNLAAAIVWGVWAWTGTGKPEGALPIANPPEFAISGGAHDENASSDILTSSPPAALDDLIKQVDGFGKNEETEKRNEAQQDRLEKLIDISPQLAEPPSDLALENRVDFLDLQYDAKHVVYLIDVGSYQLKGPEGTRRLEKIKISVLESLTKLSPNAYFNVVLCWNLREAHALGKTILRANSENKRYASEWIHSLGDTPSSLKEGRSQFYPKELLYAQVLPGVIGPWYGLATALSYDPDVVFFLAGNMPDFAPDEVSKNDYNGLGVSIHANSLSNPQPSGVSPQLSSLIRKTSGLWLVALQSERNLPNDPGEIEEIALQRLSLDSMDQGLVSRKFAIPWEKAFDNFLSGLEMGLTKIPRVHVFQTLPQHKQWPTDLQKTMQEFCETTRGSLSQL